jgi:hypothetical protein
MFGLVVPTFSSLRRPTAQKVVRERVPKIRY